MSQVGKLYKFYFKKIWQKNWLRIIVFTILIGVVWWFVIPFGSCKMLEKLNRRGGEENAERKGKEKSGFKETARLFFGGEVEITDLKTGRSIGKMKFFEQAHLGNRDYLQKERKNREAGNPEESGKEEKIGEKMGRQALESCNFLGLSFPFTANNVFFFQQTNGSSKKIETERLQDLQVQIKLTPVNYPEQNYTTGKNFWKLLFDIAWWSLTGVVVLYWFIFEVFDKTFFSPRREGEEAAVLTMTPGVKRSDVIWGKILAFLTFYFLTNIILFLIPFGIYYFWLAPEALFSWFASLALIAVIVGPILIFGLYFAPYLFLGSLLGSSKWILSTLIAFFPLLWWGLKSFSSASWPYTVERTLFDPIWFTVISLVCGIFFLALYYLRYQEEDLN